MNALRKSQTARAATRDNGYTVVVFRAEQRGCIATAIFPEMPAHDRGAELMVCYSHVGQHSSCSMRWYSLTRPALLGEYIDLKRELESIGYKLKVQGFINAHNHKRRHDNAAKADSDG